MSQSLVKNLIHLVYSTKWRKPWIRKEYQPRLHAYQASVFQNMECPALIIGGVDDHVHALFVLSKNVALKRVVEEVKKSSSKWMKHEGGKNPDFQWQAGYSAFSVSESNVSVVTKYIANQAEHHRKMSFQDELRLILTRHGIEFDEQYLWG